MHSAAVAVSVVPVHFYEYIIARSEERGNEKQQLRFRRLTDRKRGEIALVVSLRGEFLEFECYTFPRIGRGIVPFFFFFFGFS